MTVTDEDKALVKRLRNHGYFFNERPIHIAAADRIEALTAENERLRTHLAAVRDEVLEEAAKVADCFHERALEWAKSVRGLTEHLTETDSSRIATTIRAMKGDGK